MNNNELIAQADELQHQAQEVLESIDLLNYLSGFGKPIIVGSVALGLMTWHDIDIDCEMPGNLKEEDFWEAARYLLTLEQVRLITLVDNRQSIEKNRPQSMYIGAKYQAVDGAIWKIDIRFVSEQYAIAQKYLESISSKLTKENRKAILEIKNVVALDSRYRIEISSVDIYKAVLDEGIMDLEGFKEELLKSGIEL
jgi:hypothetical protein